MAENKDKFVYGDNGFLDIRLYACAKNVFKPSQVVNIPAGSRYSFISVVSGKGTLELEGKRHTAVEGQGFFLYPGHAAVLKADAVEPWSLIITELCGTQVETLALKTASIRQAPVLSFGRSGGLVLAANDLYNECLQSYENNFGILCAFNQLMRCIDDNFGDKKIPTKNFYMSRAIEYIKENYNKNISVENIANLLGIERSYLSRLFKTYKNKSTQNYIIDYRMQCAKRLFEREDLNVSQVCQAVGYTNIYCFSRIFKSRVGMPPKEYMEMCKKSSIEQD